MTASNNNDEKPIHMRLFDFDEEEIKQFNYYQILGLEEPVRATPHTIKQAYRKASIRYHPDKTGRDEGDYVFIAVKTAWDTLSDVTKRQAYDSTEMPFDDTIPPDVAASGSSDSFLYSDEDFYDTFGPVFERNLRFDTRLQQQTSNKKSQEIPTLGEEETDIDKVTAFYDYWTHFESWRDFSQKAQEELFENNNPLEDAESRYEKRFYQKEIDKRAKALKRQEMNRIQTLVRRAMAADPRLKKYHQEQKAAKEQAALERKLKKEQEEQRKREEEEERARLEEERAEKEKKQKAEEKAQREKDKKQLRKAKQQLRKVTIAAFQESSGDSNMPYQCLESMSDEVEFLCAELSLDEINDLTDTFSETNSSKCAADAFEIVKALVHKQRQLLLGEEEAKAQELRERQKRYELEAQRKAEEAAAQSAWSKEELSALAKGVKKFPGGGANRWELIANYVNNLCRPDEPRTREECIEKYNQLAKGPATATDHAAAATKDEPSPAVESPTNGNNKVNGDASVTNGSCAEPLVNGVKTNPIMERSTSTMTDASTTSATSSAPTAVAAKPTPAADEADWTEEQDKLLQEGLAKFPANMDKNERWASIAKMVAGKSKKQCVQRFKAIRDAIKNGKK